MRTIGVIGLGNISIRHRKNLKEIFPECTVLAMSASGRKPSSSVEYADDVVENIEELIHAAPMFVIVASPASMHKEHSLPLIEHYIPVLIEKPVTTSSVDAEALIRSANSHKTPVAVGYCLRYLPSSQKLKQLLADDVIGDIYNTFINTGQYLPQWRQTKNYKDSVSANAFLGGGVLFELSHEIDYVLWLLGELEVNYANLRSSKELGLDVEDMADITLTSSSGSVCNIHLDFLQKTVHRKCIFLGSNGRLEWDLVENSLILFSDEIRTTLYSEPDWDKNQMYVAMINDFVFQIEKNTHNCIGLVEAKQTVVLIEDIKLKGERGVPI